MDHHHKVPKPTEVEPVYREATDIHPKVEAGAVGGAVGVVVSALALHFLDVELDPTQAALAVGVVVNLAAGVSAYLRSSKRR